MLRDNTGLVWRKIYTRKQYQFEDVTIINASHTLGHPCLCLLAFYGILNLLVSLSARTKNVKTCTIVNFDPVSGQHGGIISPTHPQKLSVGTWMWRSEL